MRADDPLPLFGRADRYPHVPGAKAPRRDTSVAAAEAMKESAPTLRGRCFGLLKIRGPMTCDEIADVLAVSILAVRPRLTELHALGLTIDSGERRENGNGKRTIAWRVRTAADTLASFSAVEG